MAESNCPVCSWPGKEVYRYQAVTGGEIQWACEHGHTWWTSSSPTMTTSSSVSAARQA
jgi:hypothetical protein